MSTAIQGICELRNQCGFASHGSGDPRPVMEAVQALLAAEAADTIVGFLHRVHRQDRTPPPSPRPSFDDNGAFNDHVDEAFGPIRIFEVEFRPSEVLFRMEPETYRIYLAEFDATERRCCGPSRSGGPAMSDRGVTESVVEQAALAWLESVGWQVVNGAEIAPGEPEAERERLRRRSSSTQRLRDALARLNPKLPAEALDDAFRKLTRPEGAELIAAATAPSHRLLVDGVTVEYRDGDGAIRGAQARVIDFDDPESNDWLAVNQFTVAENKHARRPDVVLFVNGLPLAVIELKNAADENATIWSAFQQLQTYKAEIPSLFANNALLVASDGVEARVGALGAGREWFKPWRTIAGEALADAHLPELQVVIEGALRQAAVPRPGARLHRVRGRRRRRVIKKMAGYHQFHAVQVAVAETLRAAELRARPTCRRARRYEAGTSRAASRATGGSASSGTRRARARA